MSERAMTAEEIVRKFMYVHFNPDKGSVDAPDEYCLWQAVCALEAAAREQGRREENDECARAADVFDYTLPLWPPAIPNDVIAELVCTQLGTALRARLTPQPEKS